MAGDTCAYVSAVTRVVPRKGVLWGDRVPASRARARLLGVGVVRERVTRARAAVRGNRGFVATDEPRVCRRPASAGEGSAVLSIQRCKRRHRVVATRPAGARCRGTVPRAAAMTASMTMLFAHA